MDTQLINRNQETRGDRQKGNSKMVVLTSSIAIITLNVNGLNIPTKVDRKGRFTYILFLRGTLKIFDPDGLMPHWDVVCQHQMKEASGQSIVGDGKVRRWSGVGIPRRQSLKGICNRSGQNQLHSHNWESYHSSFSSDKTFKQKTGRQELNNAKTKLHSRTGSTVFLMRARE
jgi:hypothetical protein